MIQKTINLLLIDPFTQNYHKLKDLLNKIIDTKFNLTWVTNCDQGLSSKTFPNYDAYLLNSQVGNYQNFCVKVTPHPVILITNNSSIGINALNEGISDYLLEDQLNSVLLEHSLRLSIANSKIKLQLQECQDDYQAKIRDIELQLQDSQANLNEREIALQESKQLYQNLVESIPIGIYRNDAEGNCIYINEKISEILDISFEDCLGTGWAERLHPEDKERMLDSWTQAFANKSFWQDEYRFLHRDGKVVWVLAQCIFTFNEQGENTGSVGGLMDITFKKELEKNLEESQILFQDMANNVPGAIFQYIEYPDGSNQVKYLSKGCQTIWEIEAEKVADDATILWEMVHSEDLIKMQESVSLSAQNLSDWSYEFRITTPSGQEKYLQGMGKPKQRNDNSIVWNSLLIDISEKKEQEKRLLAIFEQAAVGIAILTIDGLLQKVNQKFASILGYSSSSVLEGKHFSEFTYPDDLETSIQPTIDLISNKINYYTIEKRYICSDKTIKWISSTVSLVRKSNGKPSYLVAVVQDIETRKQAEFMLNEAKNQAIKASEAKSMFLANMSHELRTPLNSIIGFAQILNRDTSLTPQQGQRINIIHRSADHLLSLINNILEISKIEAGRINFNEVSFDLLSLLKSIKEMFNLRTRKKRVKLLLELDSNLPQYISTDESKLRQILINLVDNAIKFTEKGEIILKAQVDLNEIERKHLLKIQVEDTGLGIAPGELEQLFIPFEQTSSGRKQKGTGLGLSISHKFVELMKGEISAKSRLGVGTCFQISIPIHLSRNDTFTVEIADSQLLSLAAEQPEYRILIVDDQDDNRLLISDLLTPVGFSIKQAVNGLEAIEIWQDWQPDLILMDIQMPEMDGYVATKKIRERELELDPQGFSTKIIALTATMLTKEQDMSLKSGFDDFIIKPFKQKTIWEKMRLHLGVKFIYKQVSPLTSQKLSEMIDEQKIVDLVDVSSDLKTMPSEWLVKLHQASSQLKGKKVQQLINAIPPEKKALATQLKALAEKYQFDKIVKLLNLVMQQ